MHALRAVPDDQSTQLGAALELQRQIDSMKNLKSARDERANLQKELYDLELMTLETPRSLGERIESIHERFAAYEQAMVDWV